MEGLANLLAEQGHDIEYFSYGYTLGLFKTIFATNAAANILANETRDGDDQGAVLIGHSNGCNVIAKAAKLASDLGYLFPPQALYISPALDRDTNSHALNQVDVFHTHNDMAVKFARFIPFSNWGAMGASGYKGRDTAYSNRNYTNRIKGHSDWFSPDNLEWLADEIKRFL